MKNTALLLIDIQNDYFKDGAMELPGALEAGRVACQILGAVRKKNIPVVHIQHESIGEGAFFFLPGTRGQNIHECVTPCEGEMIIKKHWPNSFQETGLLGELKKRNITKLIITGMMTFMCIDSTVRAAKELGFECTLIYDSTASPSLEFGGVTCSSDQVRAAYTAGLSFFCDRIVGSDEFLQDM